jgi:hypothetical protein
MANTEKDGSVPYPFTHRWTLGLFPCCEWCCYEHRCCNFLVSTQCPGCHPCDHTACIVMSLSYLLANILKIVFTHTHTHTHTRTHTHPTLPPALSSSCLPGVWMACRLALVRLEASWGQQFLPFWPLLASQYLKQVLACSKCAINISWVKVH